MTTGCNSPSPHAPCVRAAGFIAPCLPTSAEQPRSGQEWLHEIKHDGFRVIARRSADRVKLYSWPGIRPTVRGENPRSLPLGQSIQNPTRPTKGANAMPKVQADRLEDIGRALFVAAGRQKQRRTS